MFVETESGHWIVAELISIHKKFSDTYTRFHVERQLWPKKKTIFFRIHMEQKFVIETHY